MPPSMANYGIHGTHGKGIPWSFFRVFRVFRSSLLLPALLAPSLLHAADTPPATIVAFGDSTTAPRGPLRVYADILRDELPGQGVNARVINAGVGGNHTVAARKRFQRDVLDQKPDVVVIQFGINDAAVDVWKKPPASSPRVPLKTYEANLRFFIQAAREAGARPILMTPNPLRWTPKLKTLYGKKPYNPDAEDGFNVLLKNYARAARVIAREDNVPLIDIANAMKPKIDQLLLDGMHPNERGHRLIANRLLNTLAQVLRP